MSHIVIVRGSGASGYAWQCEDCGQKGMHLSTGPAPQQLRYAREKHRCRPGWDKRRGWCNAKDLGRKA